MYACLYVFKMGEIKRVYMLVEIIQKSGENSWCKQKKEELLEGWASVGERV